MPDQPYPPGLFQEWLGNHLFIPLNPAKPWFWLAMAVVVLLFFAALAGMQSLGSGARRRLTVVCTFVAGLFYLLSFFLPPGSDVRGTATVGGTQYPFKGKITWVSEQPDQGDDEAAEKGYQPPKPQAPAQRNLKGKILLHPERENAPKSKARPRPAPAADEDYVVEGAERPRGGWDLTVTGPNIPQPEPMTANTPDVYSFAAAGTAASLRLHIPRAYNLVKAYETPLGQFLLVMGAFTIGLGLINLVQVHGQVLVRARPGWHNSLAFFVGLIGMTVFGLWQMSVKAPPPVAPGAPLPALPVAVAGYRVFFDGLLKPLQSTTFALLGFFIVTAAYRAFRIRNVEAGLMTVIAFLVMLGQVPLGQMLTSWIDPSGPFAWLRIETITNWLLTNPNTAATRGIVFGSVTGGFALSLRVWLSLERGSYFGKEY